MDDTAGLSTHSGALVFLPFHEVGTRKVRAIAHRIEVPHAIHVNRLRVGETAVRNRERASLLRFSGRNDKRADGRVMHISGQPLIILADEQVRPTVDLLEGQSLTEIATMARLEAEKNDLPAIVFPASITSRAKEPSVAAAVQTETKLFNARLKSYLSDIDVLKSQIKQTGEDTSQNSLPLGRIVDTVMFFCPPTISSDFVNK